MERANNVLKISTLKSIYDQYSGIVTLKNSDLQILFCNQYMLDFVGYKKLDMVEGKTDYDMPWEKFANIYTEHEKETFRLNEPNTAIFPICDYNGEFKLVTCSRALIQIEGNSNAVLTHTNVINNKAAMEISNLINLKKYNFKGSCIRMRESFRDIQLTQREEECLFFMLRSKTNKMIAKILNISPRTVEFYIESLKLKFNCYSRYELVDKAFDLGYLYYIPRSLLEKVKL